MNTKVHLRTPQAEEYLDLPKGALAKMRCDGTGPAFARLSARRIVYTLAALDVFVGGCEFRRTSDYVDTAA